MISAIRAEFRKLFTVRSTYIISLIAFALLAFIALYIESYKNGKANIAADGHLFLVGSLSQHSGILAVFGAIIALLLFAHEYRYNTIMYTLTTNQSRTVVLLAKMIVIAIFIAVFTAIGVFGSLGLMVVGTHLAGLTLPHQDLSLLTYYGKALFDCEGYALGALVIIALVRNQVAALAILFIEPSTFEGLMSLLLKHNSVYMPFMALAQVIAGPVKEVGRHHTISNVGYLSPPKGALVFGLYLAVAWLIAWILFLRRDAS